MTTKQLNEDDLLKPFYRYNADPKKQCWEYLDTEYGWVMVSSKEDAIKDAKHTALGLGNSYLERLDCKAQPEYVPPPECVWNGDGLPPPPPPPPTRKVRDFSFTNGEIWIVIALVIGMCIGVYISKITGTFI